MFVQIPEAPKEVMTFMEDLPEDEQDVSGLGKYGAGEFSEAMLTETWHWG